MAVSSDERKLPSGPEPALFGGHVWQFRQDALDFVLTNMQDYGDLVSIKFLDYQTFQVNHPDLIQEVLVKQAKSFRKSPLYRMTVADYLGTGLLVSEGDFWKRQRKMMQPAFHTQRINAYAETMSAYTQRMLDSWQPGETLDIADEMMKLTLYVVGKTLFDVDMSERSQAIAEALEYMLDDIITVATSIVHLPKWLPTPRRRRRKKTIQQLTDTILDIIKERRTNFEDRGDLLSMLLAARDDDGNAMTDKQIRDEALTIVLAGHETTANALTWTLYLLSQHPQIEAALLNEIQTVAGDTPPGLDHLPDLRYTEMVIKEGMRLFPPVWSFARQATEDVPLDDYRVLTGEIVFIAPYALHRDPRWFPEPERFDPQRFNDTSAEQIPRYAYVPFAAGPRVCIGNNFAMMEAKIILASIVQRYHLTLKAGYTPVPEPLVTLRPKEGMPMRPDSR